MITADNKWFTRVVVVAAAIIPALDSLHLKYLEVGPDELKERFRERDFPPSEFDFPGGGIGFPY